MVTSDWKKAYRALAARAGNVDQEQAELVRRLGLKVSSRLPAAVAAALIREQLAAPLREAPSVAPTQGQLEYLGDLVSWLGIKRPAPIDTRQQVSAWLDVLELRRAAAALNELRPVPGDIIAPINQSDEPGEVASISLADGRINVRGPGGRGTPPHRARIEARADDASPTASQMRTLAVNHAAARARTGFMPSLKRVATLQPFQVEEKIDSAAAARLESVIDSAGDEKPIQAFIQQHRELLVALRGPTSLGTYVRNQPSLGGQRYPDFALAVVDSGGVHWTLIELESPRANAGLKSGQLAEKARTAVQQIETWREWLTVNLDFARRPRDEDGLGLVEIRPQCPGLVLIGRRASMRQISTAVQRRLLEEQHIALHSYDWLLDALGRSQALGGAPGFEDLLDFQ